MTPAIWSLFSRKAARTASISLKGRTIVSPATASRNARAVWLAVSERAASGFYQQRISVAVITTGELDDLVAFSESSRQPQAGHRRLCATIHHPDFSIAGIHAQISSAISTSRGLGMPKLTPRCAASRIALTTTWRRVSEEWRGPSCPRNRLVRRHRRSQYASPSRARQNWFAAHRPKTAHRRIHTAGDPPASAREKVA